MTGLRRLARTAAPVALLTFTVLGWGLVIFCIVLGGVTRPQVAGFIAYALAATVITAREFTRGRDG